MGTQVRGLAVGGSTSVGLGYPWVPTVYVSADLSHFTLHKPALSSLGPKPDPRASLTAGQNPWAQSGPPLPGEQPLPPWRRPLVHLVWYPAPGPGLSCSVPRVSEHLPAAHGAGGAVGCPHCLAGVIPLCAGHALRGEVGMGLAPEKALN